MRGGGWAGSVQPSCRSKGGLFFFGHRNARQHKAAAVARVELDIDHHDRAQRVP